MGERGRAGSDPAGVLAPKGERADEGGSATPESSRIERRPDPAGRAHVAAAEGRPAERTPAPPESRSGDERPPDSINRRSSERIEVMWSVDCETEDTFLYASITNISEMGIFVRTTDPLPVGTHLTLRFAPPRSDAFFVMRGSVQWVNTLRPLHDNPNPGMGVRFLDMTLDDRERLVEAIRTIAYIRDEPSRN